MAKCWEVSTSHMIADFAKGSPMWRQARGLTYAWFDWPRVRGSEKVSSQNIPSRLKISKLYMVQFIWCPPLVQYSMRVDRTSHLWYYPSASPVVIVWKLVDQHLFHNIIFSNFMMEMLVWSRHEQVCVQCFYFESTSVVPSWKFLVVTTKDHNKFKYWKSSFVIVKN